jgi:hypothetical protein
MTDHSVGITKMVATGDTTGAVSSAPQPDQTEFTRMDNYTNPNRPTSESPLVERVRWAIGSAEVESLDTPDWTEEAVAAVKEVAKWLEEKEDDYFSYTDAFELLRRQANA